MGVLDVVVTVPAIADDLDESDAALEQPPGHEALATKLIRVLVLCSHAVEREGGGGLLGEVGGLGNSILHEVGLLVVGDGGFDDLILRGGLEEDAVELADSLHFVVLERFEFLGHHEVVQRPCGVLEKGGALMDRRQESTGAAHAFPRAHDDEAGQVLILRAEAVVRP